MKSEKKKKRSNRSLTGGGGRIWKKKVKKVKDRGQSQRSRVCWKVRSRGSLEGEHIQCTTLKQMMPNSDSYLYLLPHIFSLYKAPIIHHHHHHHLSLSLSPSLPLSDHPPLKKKKDSIL